MTFKEHKKKINYYIKRNFEILWKRRKKPLSLRFYIDAAYGGYVSAFKRTGKAEFGRLAKLIRNRAKPRIETFYERLKKINKIEINENNILKVKEDLLKLKKDERTYVEYFRRYLVAGFPERESFLIRLKWYRDRFKNIVKAIEKLIEEEKVIVVKPYIAEDDTPKWFKHFSYLPITTGTVPRREQQGKEYQLTLREVIKMTKHDWEIKKEEIKDEFIEWLVKKSEESLEGKPLKGREKVMKTLSEKTKIEGEEDVEAYLRSKEE